MFKQVFYESSLQNTMSHWHNVLFTYVDSKLICEDLHERACTMLVYMSYVSYHNIHTLLI